MPSGERQSPVAEPRHKGLFPRCGGARRPGLLRKAVAPKPAQARAQREQAERATQASNYWSSTTNAGNPNNAWNVNFNDGSPNNNNKNNNNHVRGVRGGL